MIQVNILFNRETLVAAARLQWNFEQAVGTQSSFPREPVWIY